MDFGSIFIMWSLLDFYKHVSVVCLCIIDRQSGIFDILNFVANEITNHHSVSDHYHIHLWFNIKRSYIMRYNHWFWNSWFMNMIAKLLVNVNNYIWAKQYSKN